LAGLLIQLASLGKLALPALQSGFHSAMLVMEILESAGNKVASKATKQCVYCPARQSKPWQAKDPNNPSVALEKFKRVSSDKCCIQFLPIIIAVIEIKYCVV